MSEEFNVIPEAKLKKMAYDRLREYYHKYIDWSVMYSHALLRIMEEKEEENETYF